MGENIISEYLVKLGFKVDDTQYTRFTATIKDAGKIVESSTTGAVKKLLGWQTAITGTFVAVGSGILGMVDKVAMADQQYRLFGLHMFMAQDQAKGLKIAMDALGASLGDIAWDPELNKRFQILMGDQERMEAGLGPDFENRMRSIRDIRFQFTRLKVELQYGLMGVVSDLFEKLGLGSGGVLKTLQKMNGWIQQNLPEISQDVATYLVPILKDVWGVLKDTASVAEDFALTFTQIVGALSNNQSLESGTFSFKKFAKALETVAHWAKKALDYLTALEKKTMPFAATLGFGATGAAMGSVFGPEGAIAGGVIGGTVGAATDLYRHFHVSKSGGFDFGNSLYGRLLHSMALEESGNRQFDKNGNVITSSAGARGLLQLMPGTAAGLGVNPDLPLQNVLGGSVEMERLLQHYHGSVYDSLMAYNWGQGNLDHALASHAPIPASVQKYATDIMSRWDGPARVEIASLTVNVPEGITNAKDAQHFIAGALREATTKSTQRNLSQVAAGVSY